MHLIEVFNVTNAYRSTWRRWRHDLLVVAASVLGVLTPPVALTPDADDFLIESIVHLYLALRQELTQSVLIASNAADVLGSRRRQATLSHSLLLELDSFVSIRRLTLSQDSVSLLEWAGNFPAKPIGAMLLERVLFHASAEKREVASVVRWILRHQSSERGRWVAERRKRM